MGQTLSEPVVEKQSDSGADDRLFWGLSAMQGWRISMEDAHAAVLDLQEDNSKTASPENRVSFFGVYDGHGGEKVAAYSGHNVHKILATQDSFRTKSYAQALKDGFLATDRAILQDKNYKDELSGCTASVALITNTKIYVANAGDSRTVLGIKGRAKPLSQDHKPQNENEKARIVAAGGFVDFGRVNGNLALSRAIGDFEFKKKAEFPPERQIVTAYPDVSEHDITADDEFLVLACDGIWDCESSQSVIEFVRRGIAAHQPLEKICENMMNKCLSNGADTGGVGCDNMTMIIVGLLHGKSQEEWYNMIAKRVADGDGPCAPPEYAELRKLPWPHHYDSSPDEFDNNYGGRLDAVRSPRGNARIIVLGDGKEVLSDTEDAEMFDDEEDKDEEELQKKKFPGKNEGKSDELPKSNEATTNGTSEVVKPDQSSR